MKLTLRARLATVSAIVFALLLASVGVVSYRVLAYWLDADATLRLTELTDGLRGYLRFDGSTPQVSADVRDPEVAAFIHDATQYYQAYDAASGRLIAQSEAARSLRLALTSAQVRALVDSPRPIDVGTRRDRVRISNSVIAAGGQTYLVQAGVSLAAVDSALRRYRDLLLCALPPSLLVAALAAWGLAGVALSPLVRVADAVGAIDVRSLAARLPVRGTRDELDRVAVAFNDTLDRLEKAIEQMRVFSAALAHELRTPLAILRGEIELGLRTFDNDSGRRDMLASQLEEIDRLKRLIDQILTLARAESGQIVITFARVPLGSLAISLVDQLQPLADARGIELSCECDGDVAVTGDTGWLERLIVNLLDNALKFTREGGRVVVSVSRSGAAVRLVVRDNGIGMSAEDARRAFERFYRADPPRSTDGAGLGLSLAQWIVQSHHGTVTLDTRAGAGATFTVTLPAFGASATLHDAGERASVPN